MRRYPFPHRSVPDYHRLDLPEVLTNALTEPVVLLVAGLFLLAVAVVSFITYPLLVYTGGQRHTCNNSEPPQINYCPGQTSTRWRQRLVERSASPGLWSRWWWAQLRWLSLLPGRGLPTVWFLPPLALFTGYNLSQCAAWGLAWWFLFAESPVVDWSTDRFLTWRRVAFFINWLERWPFYEPSPFGVVRSWRGARLRGVFFLEGWPLRTFEWVWWVSFPLLFYQVKALRCWWDLAVFRRRPPWFGYGYHFHYHAQISLGEVRRGAVVSTALLLPQLLVLLLYQG